MAIISIFGLAGTGTSTCGKLLAQKLGYEFVSTGNIFRQMAKDRGLDLYEFEKLVQANPEIDKEFDKKIEDLGKEKNNFIIESRLAWYFIPNSIKIKFVCDDEIRTTRVAKRDRISIEEAKEKTIFREGLHKERYKRIYGLDYTLNKNFDFIIDSGGNSPNEIVALICKKYLRE